MGSLLLELVFPAEIQTVGVSSDEEVKNENLSIRVMSQGSETYLIHVWSDSDVFFNLSCRLAKSQYDDLRREQQLVVGFDGFPLSLNKLLLSCVNERLTHAALLLMEANSATLHIVCKLEHKIVELLSLPFEKFNDADLRNVVQDRFSELQAKLEIAEARVAEYASMFRAGRVPSLFGKPTNGLYANSKHY